jgi:Leucine-rich repeat (LRR) protein
MNQTINDKRIKFILLDDNGKRDEKNIQVSRRTLQNYMEYGINEVTFVSFNKEKLIEMDFSSNNIEKIGKNLFASCQNLLKINFGFNKLTELDKDLFKGCKKTLSEIFFGGNEIADLHPGLFARCQKLQKIRFNNNKLKELNKELFSGCKDSLTVVDFSSNEIENLPMEIFQGCIKLLYAFFNRNKIKKIEESLFKDCKKSLELISFAYNQIDQLGPALFKGCKKLQSISLNNNKLEELSNDIFYKCKALTKINFSCNRLTNLGNLSFEKFTFHKNDLDAIDINFSNNFITSFQYFSIESVKECRIDLRDNLKLLDSFQLLFRKLDKNNRDQEEISFTKVEDKVENKAEDKDIVLARQNNIESLLFLIILNSKIYNNEDDNVFKEKYAYFNDVKQKKISILDFLILIGNDCFSNDNLIHLNESFEVESWKTQSLVNVGFQITKTEAIEALCQRNDYSTFKKTFGLDKLKYTVKNPKEFIESINFLKCFDIALKNNNEKIGKYLLKILSFYTFYLNTKVEDPGNASYINKIDDKFNKQFLDSDSLKELDIIKIIKKLSAFFNKNSKKEKYRDRDRDLVEEEFKGEYELFLVMGRKYFYDTFESLVKNELNDKNNLNKFNQIFLKIYFEAFFLFEWYEAIEFFFDLCKMYTEVDMIKEKYINTKFSNINEYLNTVIFQLYTLFDRNEFLPFFCFNEIGYIQRQQKNNSNNQVSPEPQNVENKAITVPFSTFFIFKLVKNIKDESIRKKFLNHQTFLNLVKLEWHSMAGLIYYLKLFMYLIFLVFYSINIEIYSKSDASSSKLNLTCKIICLIFLFIFWLLEFLTIRNFEWGFYRISKGVMTNLREFISFSLSIFAQRESNKSFNFGGFFTYSLGIFSIFYDIYGSSIEVKSSFYAITVFFLYFKFIFTLDKISFWNLGAMINVIGKIIKKSIPITLLLLIVAIGFILSFRNRSTYYEMSGHGGDDLTQMSTFNTTFEFNLFQILQFGLGGIATSQMGIDMIQGSNFVNYIIYGCFIFIMPIMFFNILTAISLDAIGDMMENASDDIILNKIDYFELKFYIEYLMATQEDKKFSYRIGRIISEINEIIYNVHDFIYEGRYFPNGVKLPSFKLLKNLAFDYKANSKSQEEKGSLAKSIEKTKESLISMIKSLSNKVEINDRAANQELEHKLNKINDKITETESNTKEKLNEIDAKLNKMNEKFEQIIMTLNQLNNKRVSSETQSGALSINLDIGQNQSNNLVNKNMESAKASYREFQIDDHKDENNKYFENIKNAHSKTDSALPNKQINNK